MVASPFASAMMPRRPRLLLPGVPLHITQRGVNRGATFIDADDHRLHLALLADVAGSHGIDVHAFVMMSNHVHLLVTPRQTASLAYAMRMLNQQYVGTFNRRHGRTGTLWESRFRSCLVDSERYALTLYRYIELNPVRAAMVDAPERYRWSSARAHLGMSSLGFLTAHDAYTALGADAVERARTYGEWLRCGMADEDLDAIRSHIQQQRALGSPRFQAMVAKTLNRPVAVRPRGRPKINLSEDARQPSASDSNG